MNLPRLAQAWDSPRFELTPTDEPDTPTISQGAIFSEAPPASPSLAPERYTDIELLGEGGEGRVYSAVDRNFARSIAMKVMRTQASNNEQRRRRFIREARITAALEHPNILPVHDLDTAADGRPYFTMRLARGKSLAELISRAAGGTVPDDIDSWDKKLRIIDKVCDAVAFAHSQGFVHQDIKPANVLVGDYGDVVLLDWGTALSREERERQAWGMIMGTPAYMAPEQARSEPVDERSDVYCLGATLFHLLALRKATTAADMAELLAKKCAGELDDVPCPADVPSELFAIARRALAASPDQRFSSAKELQAALREVQSHHESLRLTTLVARELEEHVDDPLSFDAVTLLQARIENALDLWPENARAQELSEAVRERYVELALEARDLGLARRILAKPVRNRARLLERLSLLEATERRQRARARWTWLAGGSAMLLLTALVGFFVRDYYLQQGRWRTLTSLELDGPTVKDQLEYGKWDFTDRLPVPPERVSAEGLLLEPTLTYWLKQVEHRGDFRFTATVKWPERVDGFELLGNAERAKAVMFWHMPAGVGCQFGGFRGAISFFSLNEQVQAPDTSRAVYYPFEVGQWYELTFERREGRVRLLADGEEVYSEVLLVPFEGLERSSFGIRSWAPILVSRIELERLSIPEKASPVVAGDGVFRLGLYQEAVRAYQLIAEDYPNSEVGEMALAKAYLAAARSGNAQLRIRLLNDLAQRHPKSRLLGRCEELEAVTAWKEGNYDDALERVAASFARDSESRVALEVLSTSEGDARNQWPDEAIDGLMTWVGRTTRVHRLNLSGMRLKSLAFLKQHRIGQLIAENNAIHDLKPLQKMELDELKLSRNPVSDLSPLKGKRLKSLSLNKTKTTSIEALRGAPLEGLFINFTGVKELAAVASLKQLATLEIRELGVRDLEPLRGLPLKSVAVDRNPVTSLEPLRGMALKELSAEKTEVGSLEPLRGMPLEVIRMSGAPVRDIRPLSGMTSLKNVYLNDCGLSDLSPLSGLVLDRLEVAQNRITNAEPLGTSKIKNLLIAENQLTDASPLARSSTADLDLLHNPLRQMGELIEAPPERLLFSVSHLAESERARAQRVWSKSVDGQRRLYFADVQEAYERNDPSRLLSLRRRVGEKLYLPIHVAMTRNEALDFAQRLGGELLLPERRAQLLEIIEAMPAPNQLWLDLTVRGQQLLDRNGRLVNAAPLAAVLPEVFEEPDRRGVFYVDVPGIGGILTADLDGERFQASVIVEWPANSPSGDGSAEKPASISPSKP